MGGVRWNGVGRTLATGLALMSLVGCGGTAPSSTPSEAKATAPAPRIPSAAKLLEVARRKPWGEEMAPTPLVKIETGIFRHVPYASYRSGDFEINVYGDPDRPAGFEIGVYGAAVSDIKAKDDCKYYVMEVLPLEEDQLVVKDLKMAIDKKTRNGVTFEVTPPTGGDAFMGWWLSVFSPMEISAIRQSPPS